MPLLPTSHRHERVDDIAKGGERLVDLPGLSQSRAIGLRVALALRAGEVNQVEARELHVAQSLCCGALVQRTNTAGSVDKTTPTIQQTNHSKKKKKKNTGTRR